MTVTEAFMKYDAEVLQYGNYKLKTRVNYRSALNSFVRCCGDIPVELVTHNHITEWKRWREQVGITDSTIAGDISRIRRVYGYLRRLEYRVIDSEAMERPRVTPSDPVWLTIQEVRRLIAAIENSRDKAIAACLFASGARISELISLNRDSIQNNEAQISGKGDRVGTLRFDEYSMQILQDYLATRKDSLRPLFISSQMRRINPGTFGKALHVYADRAGIDKNVTAHILRHSFATDLRLNGADIYEVKEQLRHQNISTTQIYVHIGNVERKEGYNKFHSQLSDPKAF